MNQSIQNISDHCDQLIELQIALAYLELSQDWNPHSDQAKIHFFKTQFFDIEKNKYLNYFSKNQIQSKKHQDLLNSYFQKILNCTVSDFDFQSKRELLKLLFNKMHRVFQVEQTQNEKIINVYFERFCFFRSFDFIDDIIGIDYSIELNHSPMKTTNQRLYEGAGVGVQSSYSTLYQIFNSVDFKKNSNLIDLGSGYGRLGFYLNVLRPDVYFIGFEYLDFRVDQANKNLGNISSNNYSQFVTQDLSSSNFILPEADYYYLYDPFTEATYELVMNQLIQISNRKNITLISKGNSKYWLRLIHDKMYGYQFRSVDNGHIAIIEKPTA